MTPLEMIAEFKNGCSNAIANPGNCVECLNAFLRNLEQALKPAREAHPEDFGCTVRSRDGALLVFEQRPNDYVRNNLWVGGRSYASGVWNTPDRAQLDGGFTAHELREVARHMEDKLRGLD